MQFIMLYSYFAQLFSITSMENSTWTQPTSSDKKWSNNHKNCKQNSNMKWKGNNSFPDKTTEQTLHVRDEFSLIVQQYWINKARGTGAEDISPRFYIYNEILSLLYFVCFQFFPFVLYKFFSIFSSLLFSIRNLLLSKGSTDERCW